MSRRSRDLFDQIRDPDGVAVLNTLALVDPRHRRADRTYRTYLCERLGNSYSVDRSITSIESYTTIDLARAGHLRHRQRLWGY